MKFDYFELLSPDPIYVQNVGGIVSPKLKDISFIGLNAYRYYLSIILMNPISYFSMIGQSEYYDSLSDQEKEKLSIFELLDTDEKYANLLTQALNFFIKEEVYYSSQNKCFLVREEKKIIGAITKETYSQICNLICQRNCIKSNQEEDLSKIKSKKALEIIKKLQKGRSEKAKTTKSDKNMELGNIISAVANRSPSLNILNIWELTVFQVWDCFSRLSNNNIYDIQSTSVAVWGDKDNHFDATAWFKRIDTVN